MISGIKKNQAVISLGPNSFKHKVVKPTMEQQALIDEELETLGDR